MIKFGPSGNGEQFYAQGFKSTTQAPEYVSSMGLNAYEYSFGRGVSLGDETAIKIAEQASKYGVVFSVHAPYYINFANPDQEMVNKSKMYLINSANKVRLLGGNRVIFHASTVGKASRSDAVALTMKRLIELANILHEQGYSDLKFCPETMGKINQIGDLEETIAFCKLDEIFLPTLDFGHLNARTFGGIKTKDDYRRILDYTLDQLGFERAKQMHVHFSKIEYSSKGGEVRHLTFEDKEYGPDFQPLAELIKEYRLEPTIISESAGSQDVDSLKMKQIYSNL